MPLHEWPSVEPGPRDPDSSVDRAMRRPHVPHGPPPAPAHPDADRPGSRGHATRRRFVLAGLAVGLLSALACGGAPPAERTPDAGLLALLTEPQPSVAPMEQVPLRVRLLAPDGSPVAQALVAFAPQQDAGDRALSAITVLTGADGIAETIVAGGDMELDFDVRVSVPDDDTVEPLTVRVRVQPKSAADHLIRVAYEGEQAPDRVVVSLYEVDRPCATLVRSPTDPPSSDVPWCEVVLLSSVQGGIPDRGLILPPNVHLRYAVARGTDGGADPLYTTFGCVDSIPAPDPTKQTVITIPLGDL